MKDPYINLLRNVVREKKQQQQQNEILDRCDSYRSPYISWDWPNTELRPASLRVGRWPDTSYFRTGLSLFRSHVKRKRISDRVQKLHVFSSYGSII